MSCVYPPTPAPLIPVTPEGIKAAFEYLLTARHCLSHNESYCGEPEGDLKRMVRQLERVGAHPPFPTPIAV